MNWLFWDVNHFSVYGKKVFLKIILLVFKELVNKCNVSNHFISGGKQGTRDSTLPTQKEALLKKLSQQ